MKMENFMSTCIYELALYVVFTDYFVHAKLTARVKVEGGWAEKQTVHTRFFFTFLNR